MATTTVLEAHKVAPPPGAEEMTLPLSMFDMMWIRFHPIRRLVFYDCHCSTLEFTDTILSRLKESLSLALKHFPPVAGHLIYHKDKENKPVLRYVPGDAVLLSAAESTVDYDELVGNDIRDADLFYDFIPLLPVIDEEDEYKKVPLFAAKVTVFPGRGICIGITNHHCLGDANSIFRFVTAWASICKLAGGDEYLIRPAENSPVFDRSAIKDNLGIDTIYWKVMRDTPIQTSPFPLPTNRVRSTFILSPDDIKKLKEIVIAEKPGLTHVSSFVVTSCYTWVCFVKSGDAAGEESTGDGLELLAFAADARSRIDPPVPETYFGNCLAGGYASLKHERLLEEDGFIAATEAIAEDIKNRVSKKEEVLKGAENWFSSSLMEQFKSVRPFSISGSPKFDFYGADFGWGRGRKVEVLSIDGEKYAFSLSKWRFPEAGGLEIGLSLPEKRMAAFAAIFADGLKRG